MFRKVDLFDQGTQLQPFDTLNCRCAIEQLTKLIGQRQRTRRIVDAVFALVTLADEGRELQAALHLGDRRQDVVAKLLSAPHVGIVIGMRIAEWADRGQQRRAAEPFGERIHQSTCAAPVRQKHKRVRERERVALLGEFADHGVGQHLKKGSRCRRRA